MSAPVDEGAPVYSSRIGNRLFATNMATASRVWLRASGEVEDDLSYFFVAPGDLHNEGEFVKGDGVALTADELTRNLHMLNALSYHQQPITTVLRDLLHNQAHVGCGVLKAVPIADGDILNWARSSGTAAYFTYVDEFPDEADLGNYLETTTLADVTRLWFPTLPSNGSLLQELVLHVWMQMRRGTDTGMAIRARVYNDGFIQAGRTQYLDPRADDTPQFALCKFEGLDETVGWSAGGFIEFYAARGAAGGTPNPRWRLYSVAAILYYEVADVLLIDLASFTSKDAAYSSTTLECSFWSGTFRSIVMDTLRHAPELFLYVAYSGALTLGAVDAYAGTGSPFDLSPYVVGIDRGPYKYRERTANSVLVKFGARIHHQESASTPPGGFPSANAEDDPVNTYPARGSKRIKRATSWIGRRHFEDYRELDRHLFAGTGIAEPLASAFADSYLNLWSKDPDALDLVCSWAAIQVEPGDVVQLTDPKLGYSARRFTVVSKSFDLDADQVLLTLYDVEYTL